MPEGESSDKKEIVELDVKDVRAGYILFEDIEGVPGLKKGRVLTATDLERISHSGKVQRVTVFVQGGIRQDGMEAVQGAVQEEDAGERIKIEELPENVKVASMTDPDAAEKMKEVVRAKKNLIRGRDFQQRVDSKKKYHQSRFSDYLRSSTSSQRTEAIEAIEKYSVSSADMEGLDALEGLKTRELVDKLNRYERFAASFITAVFNYNAVYSPYVENIVIDVINDVGYHLTRALLGCVSRNETGQDFLVSHSLQVLLVSLVTAVEMTRMVQEKAEKLGRPDLGAFLSLEKKVFTLDELVNLGIAALLHDIEFKRQIPGLAPGHVFTLREESLLDTHPAGGFHLAKKLDADFDVQRAVYQHNERMDGSGGPNGVMPRLFTKYTPVLMFAEHYIESVTDNPFQKERTLPRLAILDMFLRKRKVFDGDVVYAFMRAASLFPVGSWVQLTNEKIGLVVGVNKSNLEEPIVRVFLDGAMNEIEPETFDVSQGAVRIVSPVDVPSVRKVLGDHYHRIWE